MGLARGFWLATGFISLGLGLIGLFLPIMPTVPFLILAAFAFARSNRKWEQRLLDDPRFGPSIRNWREKGAISRTGKLASTGAFAASILFGALTLQPPIVYLPPVIAVICLTWIWTRPYP